MHGISISLGKAKLHRLWTGQQLIKSKLKECSFASPLAPANLRIQHHLHWYRCTQLSDCSVWIWILPLRCIYIDSAVEHWRGGGGGESPRAALRKGRHSIKTKKRRKTEKEDQEREKEIIINNLPSPYNAFMVLPFISICNNSRFTYNWNFKINELYE